MTNCSNFLVCNGVNFLPSSETPPVSRFLQTHSGAYTTTRTHMNTSSLLFWERHLIRLLDSIRTLTELRPELLGSNNNWVSGTSSSSKWVSTIQPLINESLRNGLQLALTERDSCREEEELAITTLVSAGISKGFDVFVHVGFYVPMVFGSRENGACLAVVGPGRELPRAKYSQWVRRRKCLERLRPPLATELLLSNDGNRILEGSVTNFFIVCRREISGAMDDNYKSSSPFEVQTAPIGDGILPGVMRQLVIEVCSSQGIPLREVAPSWSSSNLWEEAFVTNSLRIVQNVEVIQIPISWEGLQSKTSKEISWDEKRFEGPGPITIEIQREILERANIEGHPVSDFL